MSEPTLETSGSYPHTLPAMDPTALTTRQLLREIETLSAIFQEKVTSINVRLEAMDKAQSLFHENLTRVPTEVDKAIAHLKELHEAWFIEKFTGVTASFIGINMRFDERDARAEQMIRAQEAALKIALDAAKEAVLQQNIALGEATSKAEAGFIKQMDQLMALFQAGMKTLDEKIGTAVKTSDDKIAAIEKQLTLVVGTGMGGESTRVRYQQNNAQNITVVGLIVMGLLTLASLVVAIMKVTQ